MIEPGSRSSSVLTTLTTSISACSSPCTPSPPPDMPESLESSAYSPSCLAQSSAWVPHSLIRFSLTTAIWSLSMMVLSLCAIAMHVPLFSAISVLRACWTSFSDLVSRAAVASSNSKILGLRTIALAIVSRCFCPPES
mmetsp:Transcript_40782/g.93856  ORF Transcript_40782/g.93856 Transcript_40782/m.93856 type:complete len:138 (+) Transcript_40782:661-1074(+)